MAISSSSSLQMTSSAVCERDHNSKSTTPLSTRQSHTVTKGSHEWLIEDFMKREETTGISLSTRFTTHCVDARGVNQETVWRLKAYPKGCDNDHSDYISIIINQVWREPGFEIGGPGILGGPNSQIFAAKGGTPVF